MDVNTCINVCNDENLCVNIRSNSKLECLRGTQIWWRTDVSAMGIYYSAVYAFHSNHKLNPRDEAKKAHRASHFFSVKDRVVCSKVQP